MFLKAAFKNASVFVQMLMILGVIAFGILLSTFLSSLLIIFKIGMSPELIKDIQQVLFDNPDLLRETQFLHTLGYLLLPAIICAWLFSDNYKEYLRIDQPIYLPAAVWTVISMLVAIPFLDWTYAINQQMVLPEAFKDLETWMQESETVVKQATELLLDTKDIPTIVFNFLAVCVVAAICEEFMFRGLLQTFFGRIIPNPHILIWTIAILFSAVHLQFYGFITRMFLGAWLGYLVYYTKTIWIPVLAHFTNNFFSVVMYYLFHNTSNGTQEVDAIGTGSTWWLSIVSVALFLFCFMQIKKAVRS